MNTTTLQITVPTADITMLKKLTAGMGWVVTTMTKRKKSGIQKGLDDIKKGNVYHAENSKDLINQIFGQKMYSVTYTGQFKKSLKRCVKRGLDLKVFTDTLDLLQANGQLPPEYRAHRLVGDYEGCWECHMRPNWLLIWRQNDIELELVLVDTGSHSDLF